MGVLIIRTIVFWGLYWGTLILGNYHIALRLQVLVVFRLVQSEGTDLCCRGQPLKQPGAPRRSRTGPNKVPEPCKTVASQPQWELYELESKLLKGGYVGDYMGDYYRGHEGGC